MSRQRSSSINAQRFSDTVFRTRVRQADDIVDWIREDSADWDGPAILDGPSKRLSDADIAGLRVRLERVRHLQRLIKAQAALEVALAQRWGVGPTQRSALWRRDACRDIATS